MPFVGDTFNRLYNWVTDRNNGVKIQAVRMDAEFDGIATALSTLKAGDTNSIKKDGTATVTANIPFANYRLTGVGDATALTDALNKKAADKAVTTSGSSTAYTATSGYSLADGTVQDGTTIRIRPHTASGATPTLAVDTMTARAIRRQDGLQIGANELVANSTYDLVFRASDTSWYLIGAALPSISGNALRVLRVNSAGTGLEFAVGGGVTRSARTSNTILAAADLGTFVDVTSGTFTQTLTAAATLGSGWWCYIRNSGSGDVTIDPNGSETIDGLTSFVIYPGEVRLIQCDGSAFYSFVISPFAKTFTSSGTFTKPPGYSVFCVAAWGGGGGGGKLNSPGYFAGGGGGGAHVRSEILASVISATETVTIGAGGAAATTSGSSGSAGGDTTFGSRLTAYGGGGGSGGTAGSNSGSGGGGGGALSAGGAGTTGSSGGAAGQPSFQISSRDYGGVGFGGGHSGGGSAVPPHAAMGGGAGGATSAAGGNSVWGGGGGGSSSALTAGSSVFGGAGGAGGDAVSGTNGTAPGGGGGATNSGATAGAGARGELRIWGII